MNNHLGVGVGIKDMTSFFKFGAELKVIEDFAVKDYPESFVFIVDRLPAPGKVNNAQPGMGQPCQAVLKIIGNPAAGGETVNIVGDASIAWKDFALLVYKVLDSGMKPVRLPKIPALLAAAALSGIFLALGSRDGPPLTFYRIRRSTVEYVFSNAKAKRLLGFTPSFGIEAGMRAAAAAYRER